MLEKIKYSKNCPNCGCEQIYTTKYTLINMLKTNQICKICSIYNRITFNETETKKIIELYTKNRLSFDKIAEIFNVSRFPIQQVIKNAGLRKIKGKTNKIILSKEDETKIITMFLEEYKSNKEISIIFNVSRSFITKLIKKHGVFVNRSERASIGLIKYNNKISYSEFLEKLPEYKKYKTNVNRITRKQPINTLEFFDKRGISGIFGSYQLDHKYSISEGFKNGISPEIIGDICNLEFIPWENNNKKRANCSITIEKLIKNK